MFIMQKWKNKAHQHQWQTKRMQKSHKFSQGRASYSLRRGQVPWQVV